MKHACILILAAALFLLFPPVLNAASPPEDTAPKESVPDRTATANDQAGNDGLIGPAVQEDDNDLLNESVNDRNAVDNDQPEAKGFFGPVVKETEIGEEIRVADPLAPWNRAMFQFNDRFYFWVLKPVTRAYARVVPHVARTGVSNFFGNITTPVRLASSLLQGKGEKAAIETSRFMINSVFGLLGFRDFAAGHGLPAPSREDLGQTMAVYGLGNGFYVVWPFIGAFTLRDTVGWVGDLFLDPVSYVEPVPSAPLGIDSYKVVNETSFELGDYESFKEAAVDPYTALRNAYIQYRQTLIRK